MGHIVSKNVYRKLGFKIDKLTIRAPWNEALHNILKELFTDIEADVVVKMPYGLSNLERIAAVTGYHKDKLVDILKGMSEKGLVMDLYNNGEYHYFPSPIIDGFADYAMMRTKGKLDTKLWAELLHTYWTGSEAYHKANLNNGNKIVNYRALPHTGAVAPEDVVEILPYEKAEAIVDSNNKFAIGICACRHEAYHVNEKACDVPLETCLHFGFVAEWLTNHGMARMVSRKEIVDSMERCKNLGTIFSAENCYDAKVICCCCKCCCGMIRSINKFGYHNALMTSNFIAEVIEDNCSGCGKCVQACPINAISLEQIELSSEASAKKRLKAKVDRSICLGCGLCSLKCECKALFLKKRRQRVIYPETTFERSILTGLEKGTLQYQLFDDPKSITHIVMRGIVGGFLRLPPVKKTLLSDMFRSKFLNYISDQVKKQGYEWILRM